MNTLAVGVFICGLFVFLSSFHNVDLAWNADSGCIDTNGFGYQQSPEQMYMNGASGLNVGAVMMVAGFLMLLKTSGNEDGRRKK